MRKSSNKLPEWARGALWSLGAVNLLMFIVLVLPWLLKVLQALRTLAPLY